MKLRALRPAYAFGGVFGLRLLSPDTNAAPPPDQTRTRACSLSPPRRGARHVPGRICPRKRKGPGGPPGLQTQRARSGRGGGWVRPPHASANSRSATSVRQRREVPRVLAHLLRLEVAADDLPGARLRQRRDDLDVPGNGD